MCPNNAVLRAGLFSYYVEVNSRCICGQNAMGRAGLLNLTEDCLFQLNFFNDSLQRGDKAINGLVKLPVRKVINVITNVK